MPELLAISLGFSLLLGSTQTQAQAQAQTQPPPPATAQGDPVLPATMLGNRVAPMLLLTRPEIRADLGLTAEQAESALKTLHDLRAQGQSIRGQGNDPAVIARRRAIDEAQDRWLQANLNDDQALRLGQIALQWQGPWALARPVAAEMLGLSDEQAARIRRLLSEAPTAQETIDRVIAVLTPAQRERWRNLLGKPVAFSTNPPDPNVQRASANRPR